MLAIWKRSRVVARVSRAASWRLLDGAPRVIVRDGEIVTAALRRDRLTRDEILSEMRLAGIARLSSVAWAILEPQGKISFIKKEAGESPQHDIEGAAV